MLAPTGIGYFFWHAPGAVDVEEYEAALLSWQGALASHPPPGFARGWTWRLSTPPWLVDWPNEAYLDVYVVDDFAALGSLNAHAPTGVLQAAHDSAARRSSRGSGALFACVAGAAEPQGTADPQGTAETQGTASPQAGVGRAMDARLRWYDKPTGASYADVVTSVAGEGRCVWLRQLVLGSGPELLVVGGTVEPPSPPCAWSTSAALLDLRSRS